VQQTIRNAAQGEDMVADHPATIVLMEFSATTDATVTNATALHALTNAL
jgi:hypothetical protein